MDGAQNPSGWEGGTWNSWVTRRGQELSRASVTPGLGLRFRCCIPAPDPELAVEWESWYL